jgi:enoyl-CoA hydratase/carnithine racemase
MAIVETERGDGIMIIRMNRPERLNALGLEMRTALAEAWCEFRDSADVEVAIFTGTGRAFCAGEDMKESVERGMAGNPLRAPNPYEEGAIDKPVIAAINGYAMGGGLECTLSCDLRIAEEHAQMALPEPGVGLLPAGSGTQNLPWLVGEGWAKRMILTNERIDAATALRIGLVQEVVPKGKGLEAATSLADRVATLSPRAIEYCKALIHNARNGIPRRAGLALERERFMDLFDHSDQAEGVAAFLEKRKPEWKND